MSKFQVIIILVIIAIVVLAVLIISGVLPGLPGGSGQNQVSLIMWGTLPADELNPVISSFNSQNQKKFYLTYYEQDKNGFENKLVNALASGTGPDIWVISQDLVLSHQDKIFKIPFTAFSERDYRDLFVDVSDLFILNNQIVAVPFIVDPLVLYWNKDLFNKAALASPPSNWEQFLSYVPLLTKVNDQNAIEQSGAAMGEFSNILNAKEIFSMLVLQSGNKIIQKDPERGGLELVFGNSQGYLVNPAESALNFYLNFSNPSKISYSWNRSL